jgi:hypothetical protein
MRRSFGVSVKGKNAQPCHARESGHPEKLHGGIGKVKSWIPAYAGMT